MVREWDPRTASSAEIASLLDTLNAVLAADLPQDPPWRANSLREYLSEVMPGERRISWVAQDDPAPDGTPGAIVGHVHVLLLGGIGVLEVLTHPARRRTGIGRELVRVAARRVWDEGFQSIGVEVVGDTPAVGFYEALGFTRDYVETRSVLDLGAVDWPALTEMATEVGAGYHVEFCPGGPPDELIEAYARAKAEVREVDDVELRPSSYDPDRLRDSLATLHRRGMKPYIVLALHEQTGEVAGLTEVVVPAQHPTRADQYDTIVVREHRGYGIDRAIKARMLLELRSAEPEVAEVQTWNAQVNESMLKVNAELGYRPDRDWCEYGVDVGELVHRLDSHR
ncbi:GNAT family N-acetyltransferase [Micromonospora sp. WMMC241]|uniref:Ribosomal protein S18 acetylase RimI n=1 Tax=Micromonospora humi TaxID=745366 RepID=A0A1C5J5D1_9ACTN|nr:MULTISPECIES: GNAT family N-acetyltransferase [Micromonospora]MCZ7435215.1 GNAT family N-acetyltransferase [Micromonospora sp. WMMC241]SCG65790.1 Ribosomal protein S18 acetylase RimI [Micromonospora humi]